MYEVDQVTPFSPTERPRAVREVPDARKSHPVPFRSHTNNFYRHGCLLRTSYPPYTWGSPIRSEDTELDPVAILHSLKSSLTKFSMCTGPDHEPTFFPTVPKPNPSSVHLGHKGSVFYPQPRPAT